MNSFKLIFSTESTSTTLVVSPTEKSNINRISITTGSTCPVCDCGNIESVNAFDSPVINQSPFIDSHCVGLSVLSTLFAQMQTLIGRGWKDELKLEVESVGVEYSLSISFVESVGTNKNIITGFDNLVMSLVFDHGFWSVCLGGFANSSHDLEQAVGRTVSNFLSTELVWLND